MNKLIFKKENIGIGRRKRAVARVFLIVGNGNLIINKTLGQKYFQYNQNYLNSIWSPLEKLNCFKTDRFFGSILHICRATPRRIASA